MISGASRRQCEIIPTQPTFAGVIGCATKRSSA